MKGYDFMGMEVEPARKMIARCLKNSDQYIQLGGNHEYRIERFCIKQGVPGLATYKFLSPATLLGYGTARSQFRYVPYISTKDPTSYYRITRDLVAVHGWSYAKNAARVHLDQARSQSIVFGHCHRMESLSTRDPFSQRLIHSWCPGTLSKLQPIYQAGGSPTSWSHGFSLIYIGSKSWSHYTIPISNGSCVLPDGKEVRV